MVLLQFIHCVTVYFNNLHPYSHKAEIGSAQAYLKVQCNPVICRVVRKIHSPLTPIGVLSPLMQLIGTWSYLGNTEQFNTLTLLPLPRHTYTHPRTHAKPEINPMITFHICIRTFAHSCFMSKGIFKYAYAQTRSLFYFSLSQ